MRPFLHQTCDCLFVCFSSFFFFYLGKQTQFYLFLSLVLSPYRELLWSPVPTAYCRIVYCTCSAWLICSYSKVKAHTVSNWISFMSTVVEFIPLCGFLFSSNPCCILPLNADNKKNHSVKKWTSFAGHAKYRTILFEFPFLTKFLKLQTGWQKNAATQI